MIKICTYNNCNNKYTATNSKFDNATKHVPIYVNGDIIFFLILFY